MTKDELVNKITDTTRYKLTYGEVEIGFSAPDAQDNERALAAVLTDFATMLRAEKRNITDKQL